MQDLYNENEKGTKNGTGFGHEGSTNLVLFVIEIKFYAALGCPVRYLTKFILWKLLAMGRNINLFSGPSHFVAGTSSFFFCLHN